MHYEASEGSNRNVWWFDGMGAVEGEGVPVKAHFDFGKEYLQNLADTEQAMTRKRRLDSDHSGNDYLFVWSKESLDRSRVLDLSRMHMGGLLISSAMVNFLVQGDFDLTDTDIIELPLYDGTEGAHLGRQPGDRLIPGRWAVLHVRARKDALLRERSQVDILNKYEIGTRKKNTKLAVSEAALEGPDLWYDGDRTNNLFVSDRFRAALLKCGLRVAAIEWLRPADVI